MSDETLASHAPARLTAERYLALVEEGVLEPDDRVELLEGIIVAREPQTPWHASGVRWVFDAHPIVGKRRYAVVRVARHGETITLVAFPDVTLAVDDLLPLRDDSVD